MSDARARPGCRLEIRVTQTSSQEDTRSRYPFLFLRSVPGIRQAAHFGFKPNKEERKNLSAPGFEPTISDTTKLASETVTSSPAVMSGSSFLRSLSRGSEEATDSRDSYIRDHLISVDSDSEEDNSQHSGTDWEGRSERGEGGGGGGKSRRKGGPLGNKMLTESELQDMRLKINSRERRRMHDLNSALDGLREVMPYAHGPSVRKLSKIATLLLARNYILMLSSSLDEMKKLISDTYQSHHHHHHHPSRTISAPVLHTHAHAHAHVGSAGGLPPLPSLPTIPPLHMVIPSTMTPFSPHELPSATSMTSKDSSSTPTSMSAHHTAALGADRHVLYGRWPSPCSCTQCSPDAPRAAFHSVGGKYPSPYSSPHTFRK